MDSQTVNTILLTTIIGVVSCVIITYFSPIALRHLSAWAEARAAAIDYQHKLQMKIMQRFNAKSQTIATSSLIKVDRSNVIITHPNMKNF